MLTKQINFDDNYVSQSDMFTLEFAGDGYIIKPYNSDLVVSTKSAFPEASGTSGGENSYLMALSATAAGDNGLWIPTKYTGTAKFGLTKSISGDFIAGEQVTITAVSWSTVPGVNRQNIYVHSNYTNVATSSMNTSTAKMTMDIHTKGTVRVIYDICDDDTHLPVKSYQSTWNTKLMIPNGEYFFQSLNNERYMSLDSIFDDNIHLELLDGNKINHQRWIIEHVLDGYYTLTNAYTYDLASIPDGYETEYDSEDTAITLYTESESTSEPNSQLWKFSRNSDGSYIIKPKEEVFSSTGWCLVVGDDMWDWDEENVQIRLGSDLGNEAKWYVYSTTYHLVNYYDSSFLNSFENEATMIEHIEAANAFAEFVYNEYYGIDLVMEDPVEYTDLTFYDCPNGDNQPCTDACGECLTDESGTIEHHKNVVNISNQLYDDARPDNYIIVFWTNRTNIYCEMDDGATHYITDSIAGVYEYRPIIQVLRLYGETDQWKKGMGLTLTHEIVHTFGMDDDYVEDNPYTLDINESLLHDNVEGFTCLMEPGESSLENNFHEGVNNKQILPFCLECLEKLGNHIVKHSYMQGNT